MIIHSIPHFMVETRKNYVLQPYYIFLKALIAVSLIATVLIQDGMSKKSFSKRIFIQKWVNEAV